MLKVGITGGIGSGKSTVCKVFGVLGIPVFYADDAAKTVIQTDKILISGMKEAFGERSYKDGQLDRKYIAGIVFNDKAQLDKLNALVHPAVFRAFDGWAKQQQGVPYILKEAALLFESGSYKLCNKSILVTAPLELKLQRTASRDNISPEDVMKRMDKQFTDEKKSSMADFMIINDEQQLIIPQVLSLHEKFIALSQV